ncbi:hypothetical protein BE04_15060 [Sorangium cellulosum]|uniref:Uncharacterized protein n=1 Tax=Sorangium cellulosum TaxID=56 RepID=A0A150PWD3_SORCE|nr:hypothetical protein BE04_15060 [Sorangium cellulosum]
MMLEQIGDVEDLGVAFHVAAAGTYLAPVFHVHDPTPGACLCTTSTIETESGAALYGLRLGSTHLILRRHEGSGPCQVPVHWLVHAEAGRHYYTSLAI